MAEESLADVRRQCEELRRRTKIAQDERATKASFLFEFPDGAYQPSESVSVAVTSLDLA